MSDFKTGDKVEIIDKANPNYGCVTTIQTIYDFGPLISWACVTGGLKSPEYDGPELTQLRKVKDMRFNIGDTVVSGGGTSLMIIGIIGDEIYATLENKTAAMYSEHELRNWKLLEDEEVTEYTLSEIADELGVDVKTLRIKE